MNDVIDYAELGRNIRSVRNEKGLTQEKLAELANISATHISNIENGKAKVSLSVIFSISNVLGCSVEALVTGNMQKERENTVNVFDSLLHMCNSYERRIIIDTVQSLAASLIKNRR